MTAEYVIMLSMAFGIGFMIAAIIGVISERKMLKFTKDLLDGNDALEVKIRAIQTEMRDFIDAHDEIEGEDYDLAMQCLYQVFQKEDKHET